ncbi:MAG: trehalose utilization protein ThuA, partial [Proteobacteria bacterium]|nr:trehalose utilization protein ThuA [Pseudomonadota bacterium]
MSAGGGTIRVLCWSDWSEPKEVYPKGINGEIAEYLNGVEGLAARTGQLSDPEQGLSAEALAEADVLVWFGHSHHREVSDESVERVVKRITDGGMGFVPLHSSHMCRAVTTLWGTSGEIASWREADEWQRVE